MIQPLNQLGTERYKETIVQFGDGADLTGVFSSPNDSVHAGPVPILLNAGIVHRVGPFRLHVDLAREFAKRGIASLRLDISGLGESSVRRQVAEHESRAVLDLREAMDFLQNRFGTDQFVLIGLCSGAFNAHHTALADDRVAGAVFLDGIVYRTSGYYRRLLWQRISRLRPWRNALKRRLTAEQPRSDKQQGDLLGEEEFFVNDSSVEQTAAEIKSMIDRGMQMLFTYTEGYDDISGRQQFREMFGITPSDQVQVDYLENCEHTFRLTQNRQQIVQRIAEWWLERFSADNSKAQ